MINYNETTSLRQNCRRDSYERSFLEKVKTHELRRRLLFTLMILVVYLAGRSLLLYNVDSTAYQLEKLSSQNIVNSIISGDRYQYTLFALGIMPHITANLIMWIFTALQGDEAKARSSPSRLKRLSFAVMLILAGSFAISRAEGLIYKESDLPLDVLKAIATAEMIVGAVIVYKMANLNREHGIGAQTPIILVNILDNLVFTVRRYNWEELSRPVALCSAMAIVILIMEIRIVRIPVQRVSIHNEYADKSFIAFKPSPIGVMPVMFATSFFMLPQLFVRFLLVMNENNSTLQYISGRLNLNNRVGVIVYLGVIAALNFLFSFIMLMPGEMSKQLQKGGDSIVGIYAGKKTKRYLRRKLLKLCTFSSFILCLMMGMSLGMSLMGEISPDLALFPATGSILAGIGCPLYRELKSYRRFDSYTFFI